MKRHPMKRLIILITTLMLLSSSFSSSFTYGDVVFGNEFEHAHREEVQKLTRTDFVVNSPEGFVIAQLEPEQTEEVITTGDYLKGTALPRYENGSTIEMSGYLVYHGEYWGIMPTGHTYFIPGWIRMDQLLVSFTANDFKEINKDQLTKYSGDSSVLQDLEGIVLWDWPGSDRPKKTIENYVHYQEFGPVYQDSEGREWVEVRLDYSFYYYSFYWFDGGWVCLSDPLNSDIPAFYPAPEPRIWAPDAVYDWTVDSQIDTHPVAAEDPSELSLLQVLGIVGGVIVVLAIAAGVFLYMRRAHRHSS